GGGPDRGYQFPGLGMRDLEGVGVADDRQPEGEDAGGGGGALPELSPPGDWRAGTGGGWGGARQIDRLLGCLGVSGAREVRQPGVAHAARRARGRRRDG